MKQFDHYTNIQTKTFSYKDEIIICKIHNEVASYICTCKEKLCQMCLTEGKHFLVHQEFKIFPVKEIKRVFVNELEDLESLYAELVELNDAGKESGGGHGNLLKCLKLTFLNEEFNHHEEEKASHLDKLQNTFNASQNSLLTHFTQNFLILLASSSTNFLSDYFSKERDIVKELKKCRADINLLTKTNKALKYEDTLELILTLSEINKKANFAIINRNEKLNLLQHSLTKNTEELQRELEKFLERFFKFDVENDQFKKSNFENEEETSKMNPSKILNQEPGLRGKQLREEEKAPEIMSKEEKANFNFSHTSKHSLIFNSNNNFQKQSSKNKNRSLNSNSIGGKVSQFIGRGSASIRGSRITSKRGRERYEINTSRIESELKSLLKSPAGCFDEKEVTSFGFKSSSILRGEVIPSISNSKDLGIQLGGEYSNEKNYKPDNFSFEGGKVGDFNQIIEMNEGYDSDLSYEDKKSVFTEFNWTSTTHENRNRIDKILKRTRNQNNNAKLHKYFKKGNKMNNKKVSGGGFTNQNEAYKQNKNGNKYPYPQYENYNNFYNNPTPTGRTNKQAGTQYCIDCGASFINTLLYKKKRCPACQKIHYNKATGNKNFYVYNSYKAGKTNQACSICKTVFIVPVALAKQRRTCYYCFKSCQGNNHQNAMNSSQS